MKITSATSVIFVVLVTLFLIKSCHADVVKEPSTGWDVSADYAGCHFTQGGIVKKFGLIQIIVTYYQCPDKITISFKIFGWIILNSMLQDTIADLVDRKDASGVYIIADDQRPILKSMISSITDTFYWGHEALLKYDTGTTSIEYDGVQKSHSTSIQKITFDRASDLIGTAVTFTF